MEIKKIEQIVEENGIIFLTYGEFISQSLISGLTESLEIETKHSNINMGISTNIFTVFIELSQNIMNYAKHKLTGEGKPEGIIIVKKDEKNYYIYSQNTISQKDIDIIEPKLKNILSLDKDGIKQKYRELRRIKKSENATGGGIGFYEIAKRCERLEYNFTKIADTSYSFYLRATISNINKG